MAGWLPFLPVLGFCWIFFVDVSFLGFPGNPKTHQKPKASWLKRWARRTFYREKGWVEVVFSKWKWFIFWIYPPTQDANRHHQDLYNPESQAKPSFFDCCWVGGRPNLRNIQSNWHLDDGFNIYLFLAPDLEKMNLDDAFVFQKWMAQPLIRYSYFATSVGSTIPWHSWGSTRWWLRLHQVSDAWLFVLWWNETWNEPWNDLSDFTGRARKYVYYIYVYIYIYTQHISIVVHNRNICIFVYFLFQVGSLELVFKTPGKESIVS